ncbi:MAG: cation-transporting P-type ATPase [Chromatiales bacterium]|nr:cation-transporting P-type ATPase [Chromatiales bacterium]
MTSAVLSTGLDEESVRASRARHGANQIVEAPRHRWWDVLGDALRDPMTWFLAAASVLFAVSGERTEAIVLAVALVPFLGMDFFLHRRTSASIQGLSRSLASRATVIRAGHPIVIASVEVVPGDIVIATAGESFPADGLLAECDGVLVDESLLTGEAHPVRKEPLEAWPQAAMPIAIDGRQWGFAGTRVLSGSARMVVVFTGAQTLYGDIVRSAVHGAHDRTPLQRAVADLVRILVVAAAGLCVVLGITRLLQGYGPLDAILSALTLAVAALPEEFPVVLTFFLGVGVYRLARRQALVRRGVVVESIGRVTTLCTDKTGTITQGRLELTHCYPVSGLDTPDLLARALSASRPELGDPVDVAIARAAPSGQRGSVVARFPFTEARKRETVLVATDVGLRASMKARSETVPSVSAGSIPPRRHGWLDYRGARARRLPSAACASWMPLVPPAEDEEPTVTLLALIGLLGARGLIRSSAAPAAG